jgi:hypothetical protein
MRVAHVADREHDGVLRRDDGRKVRRSMHWRLPLFSRTTWILQAVKYEEERP